jgi:hypothetical protein
MGGLAYEESLHFEAPKQEPWIVKPLSRAWLVKQHVHHVFKNKLGEAKHMKNLKNLVNAQKSKFSTLLFMGMKTFMHAVKKGDAFFIYALPAINIEPQQHEIPFQTKATRMCLKRRMLTPY